MGHLKNNFRRLLEEHYGVSRGARLPTQAKIAEDSNIKQPTISLWLAGEVTRFDKGTIEAMCKFLRCSVGDLLEYVPDKVERETA